MSEWLHSSAPAKASAAQASVEPAEAGNRQKKQKQETSPAEASVEPAKVPGYDTGRTPSPSQTLVADSDAEVHSPAIDLDVEVHTPATDLDAEAHTPTIDMLAEVHTPTNDQACLH